MGKYTIHCRKPSVAQEFAKALHINTQRKDGYLESAEAIVTWCVGHLVTMSYPEEYDPALKRWSLETLPFIPQEFKYEVIPAVSKQFRIVSGLLNRTDVDTIYVCTDSGREGEYIYRLVEQQAGVKGKNRRRVWIDSQTEEEILRGIKEAKDLKEYDNLAASAYLRAKEDYLMGINFSRLLTLKYGNSISNYLNTKYSVVSVGRVMTCVLGMVVRREREIREFVETPFYRVLSTIGEKGATFEGEWRAVKGSKWFESFDLYKENGFKEKEKAEELIRFLSNSESDASQPLTCQIVSIEKKKEKKQEQAVPVVNKEELIAKASEKVTELESKTGDERVSLLNEIGSLYTQAEETDLAIQYYEESLELCKQHGKASTDLMKLYNKKRQEAAEAKDDEKVKEYMDKVQNLMQMSKDMIRGNA